ncbi:hypothetical protein ACIQMZ_37310 [Streptomyces longwoodensis]|uniref:hypothetical protein n=1 Tax=Streptomyces longwoodensis TaxID=68231 RepID=UPI0038209EDA
MPVDPLNSAVRAQRAFDHLGFMNAVHGANLQGKWIAIHLDNGACDQQLYPDKQTAVRFQRREEECAYLCVTGLPTLGELRYYLDENERLYDSGMSLADPATYVNPEAML